MVVFPPIAQGDSQTWSPLSMTGLWALAWDVNTGNKGLKYLHVVPSFSFLAAVPLLISTDGETEWLLHNAVFYLHAVSSLTSVCVCAKWSIPTFSEQLMHPWKKKKNLKSAFRLNSGVLRGDIVLCARADGGLCQAWMLTRNAVRCSK